MHDNYASRTILALALVVMFGSPALSQQAAPETTDPMQRILQLIETGELDEAVAVLEQRRAAGEAEPAALALLGGLYVETGQPEAALETLAPLAETESPDPAVLYNAGRAARDLGKIEEAYIYLRQSAAMAPGSPAQRELGLLLALANQYEKAYPHLRQWVNGDPEDTEVRLVAALSAVQLVRPTEALSFLQGLDPDSPQVRLLTGRAELLLADPQAAIATLEPLMVAPPPEMELDIRRTLAEAKATIGQAGEAVELLQGHVEDDPSANLQLGLAQYQSGDLEGALATLEPFATMLLTGVEEGKPLPPSDSTAVGFVREYGRLLVTAGQHAEGLPYLRLASELEPENKQVWQQLGQALAATGDREAAMAAMEKFRGIVESEVPATLKEMELKKDLEDPTGRELRSAMTRASKGEIDEALEIVRREQSMAPEDIRAFLMEVRILLIADRPLEAYALAGELVEAAPQNADAIYLRGSVAMALDDFAGAETDLRRALELAENHTAAMNDLAVLLMDKGETEEARRLLERVLELRPGDELAAANLAALEQP